MNLKGWSEGSKTYVMIWSSFSGLQKSFYLIVFFSPKLEEHLNNKQVVTSGERRPTEMYKEEFSHGNTARRSVSDQTVNKDFSAFTNKVVGFLFPTFWLSQKYRKNNFIPIVLSLQIQTVWYVDDCPSLLFPSGTFHAVVRSFHALNPTA